MVLLQIGCKGDVPSPEFVPLLRIAGGVQQTPYRLDTGNEGGIGHSFGDDALDLLPL